MRNPRFKPFWLRAEGDEWQGLWQKGVFKKWNRSDLLPNDRVFTLLLALLQHNNIICF